MKHSRELKSRDENSPFRNPNRMRAGIVEASAKTIEVEGVAESVAADVERVEAACLGSGAREIRVAESEQERERQLDVAVQKALTDWLVAQRADNVYLDTLPQERQAEQRARIRQALLKQRGAEAQPQTPEGVAREKLEDFAVTVLGLWVTREGEEGQGGLVMTKPPGDEFGVA